MSNYQQTAVVGEKHTRAVRVVIENPFANGVPAVTFIEEHLINLDGEIITKPAGSIIEPFTEANANEVFPLLHPTTGAVIGEANYTDVYVILHSLYLHVAAKRDAAAGGA